MVLMCKPFVLLFEQAVRKISRLRGHYDEGMDVWLTEDGETQVPLVESEPFRAGTRTKKEEIRDRDDVDFECFSL